MVQWSAGSTGQQQYVYDAGGQRVLTRTTSGGATSLTVSAFGLQELHYHGDGTPLGGTSNCYYYYLGGQLIGKFDGTTTRFFLLDGLGSVVASFSSTAGSAGVLGNQTYEPYGKSQYQQGSLGTSKGYTGQDADNLSGLDYDHARYYDPIAGIFLSPDSVQGNAAGMNPYAYVAGNPETATDPTGRMYVLEEKEIGGAVSGSGGGVPDAFYNAFKDDAPGLLDPDQAITTFEEENTTYSYDTRSGQITLQTPSHGETLSPGEPGYAALLSQYQAALNSLDTNSGKRFTRNSGTGWHPTQQQQNPGPQPQPGGAGGGRSGGPRPPASPSSPCSFTSDTPVMTAKGEKAIGDLQVGDRVLAYNPRSHKMEFEPILHVWKHTDSDLIDLTLTISSPAHDGEPTRTESETLHTTSEHPFLTRDQGFTPAGKLKPGLRLVRADGSVGVVTGWKMVKATRVMYNLEVAQDHTFVVGTGQWVVHNECDRQELRRSLGLQEGQPYQAQHLTPCELEGDWLVQRAIEGGWQLNGGEDNGIALPNSRVLSQDEDLPWHSGPHPQYTNGVLQLLEAVKFGLPDEVSPELAAQTMRSFSSLLRDLTRAAGGGRSINSVNVFDLFQERFPC